VRITQTGSGKTQYWSIHEFHLANVKNSQLSVDGINTDEILYLYLDRRTLYISGYEQLPATTGIKIYNTTGQNVLSTRFSGKGIPLDHLPAGIYIIVLQNEIESMSWKMIIK
jgi:hypothetical protein